MGGWALNTIEYYQSYSWSIDRNSHLGVRLS